MDPPVSKVFGHQDKVILNLQSSVARATVNCDYWSVSTTLVVTSNLITHANIVSLLNSRLGDCEFVAEYFR